MSDAALLERQIALQTGAGRLLTLLDGLGLPLCLAGSYVSGLMCRPEIDVMTLVGPGYSPRDVAGLLHRVVDLPGVVGVDYRDERGPRSPTGEQRDERYHLPVLLDIDGIRWEADLTLWLHDAHENVTAWHEELRDRITPAERSAVLRIKEVWQHDLRYTDTFGGREVYEAVLDAGVRTPEDFGAWLAEREFVPNSEYA